MEDRIINAIIQIRKNSLIKSAVSDSEIEKLIRIGDRLRADMNPQIEVEYDETQQMAIICSSACEIENDTGLDEFDFDEFDKNFENEFLSEKGLIV